MAGVRGLLESFRTVSHRFAPFRTISHRFALFAFLTFTHFGGLGASQSDALHTECAMWLSLWRIHNPCFLHSESSLMANQTMATSNYK